MTWKAKLRDELVSRIQQTGLTVYLVYDPKGGCNVNKQPNIQQRDLQDEFISSLTNAGINVQRATWDIDTYDNRGILVTFWAKKLAGKQRFTDMIKSASNIKWIICINQLIHGDVIDENFTLFAEKTIRDTDGAAEIQLWKRIKSWS